MKKLLLFFSLIFGSTLFGALPPLAQSSKEIQALLADSQVQTFLRSGEVIQAILRTEEGYVLMTQSSLLRVDLETLSQARPGPKEFRFHFYPPIDLKAKS